MNFRKISSRRVVVTSFVVDVSDVIVNVVIALFSGSVVMLTQALEGAADLLASSFLLIGVRRSKRPRDKKHPYGYGRELYFWTFMSALITFALTSVASFYYGYKRFINPEPIENITLAFVALTIGIITNGYAFSLSARRLMGKKSLGRFWFTFKNSVLIETKTTLVLDAMGTIASVLGLISLILYRITGNLRFDGLGAMAVGVTLAVLVFYIIDGARDLLVGQSASVVVEEKIRKTALTFSNVKSVIDLRTLHMGPEKLLVNIEVNLADKLTTDEIETLIDKIEKSIKKKVPAATNIMIELETPDV